MTGATVTVSLVCPYCDDVFDLADEHSIDNARSHVDAHTIGLEDEARAHGG
jgi:glutaredoxin